MDQLQKLESKIKNSTSGRINMKSDEARWFIEVLRAADELSAGYRQFVDVTGDETALEELLEYEKCRGEP